MGSPSPRPVRSRAAAFAFLALGLAVAAWLGAKAPREQHVRIVLGAEAPRVTAVGLAYLEPDGDVAREAHFTFAAGTAPRILAHDPELPNADYRVEIDLETREGRRSVQRQVRLGGGSTQIDVASALVPAASPSPSAPP